MIIQPTKMTFYQKEILKLKKTVYPNDDLCRQVMQAKNFIDNNFANKLALKDMAGEAYYSKFHFLRLFKQLYGKTPHQYLTAVRIQKAKQLLQAGLPVAEVCFSVGFESISSFKGLFKRYTLLTPNRFQNQVKNKQPLSQTPFRFLPLFFSLKKSNFQDEKLKSAADL